MCVLVIDDEEVSRYIFKGYLSGTRFMVKEATGGSIRVLIVVANAEVSLLFLLLLDSHLSPQ